jgi:hypothetical protein
VAHKKISTQPQHNSKIPTRQPKRLKKHFQRLHKTLLKVRPLQQRTNRNRCSKFKAVNSKANNFTKKKIANFIARLDKKIAEINNEMDKCDQKETKKENVKTTTEQEPREILKQHITELYTRKKVYQGYAEKLEQTKETQISLTDRESRLMMSNGKADVCYNIQIAVDSKNKLVAEFEVTNAINDLNLLSVMTTKVAQTLEVSKLVATADEGYASATDIVACVTKGFEVHVAGGKFDVCVPCKEEQAETVVAY